MRVFAPSSRPCVPCPKALSRNVVIHATAKVETPNVTIRKSNDEQELMQAAQMRAAAYYENETFNRFKDSFIKQFASIEHKRLCTAVTASSGQCIPILAIDSSGTCSGSLDIQPNYIPEDEEVAAATQGTSAYVCNVVVAPQKRRSGIGRLLIQNAKEFAIDELGAEQLFAHVESVNDGAAKLYENCGFVGVAKVGGKVNGTLIGEKILLKCDLKP